MTSRNRRSTYILDQAAACGINFIDTAECYGDHLSERLIGDYLSRRDRSRWIVAHKIRPLLPQFHAPHGRLYSRQRATQLESSLRSLRVETIDLYQFHSGIDDSFRNARTVDDAR